MLSADDVSCSSSQVSAKSEKNMADFDGEESGCEEELVQINSHAELSSHLQQHLPNLASIYHEHLVQGEASNSFYMLLLVELLLDLLPVNAPHSTDFTVWRDKSPMKTFLKRSCVGFLQ